MIKHPLDRAERLYLKKKKEKRKSREKEDVEVPRAEEA